jgi:hypothetical protein
MRMLLFRLFGLVLAIVLFISGSVQPAVAQEAQPPTTPEPTRPAQPPFPGDEGGKPGKSLPDPYERSNKPESAPPIPIDQTVFPLSAGGPDDYGYTWDDSIPFNWIDATSGIESDVSGDDVYSGPVNIGFSFKFYENTYNQLFFNTNGLVTFGSATSSNSNSSIPQSTSPNNLIAVLWDDLAVGQSYNPGHIYYRQAGIAPNRNFTIEWYDVTGCCYSNATDYKTFEVTLNENGDIVTQYQFLSGDLQGTTVGIEDSMGASGLQYLYNTPGLAPNLAVKFTRPAPSARVSIDSLYHGQLTHPGEKLSFQISLRNTGDLGSDTYDLIPTSAWSLSLYRVDGTTPLGDTNGNSFVDTGLVSQAGTMNIVVKIQVPGGVLVGDTLTATITARSSRDTSKSKTVTLQTAIPAPFAQVYLDSSDNAMSLYLAQPGGQSVKKAADNWYGFEPAVAEAPNGNFVYAWHKGRCVGNNCGLYTDEIEFALLNKYGEIVQGVSKGTDNSAELLYTFDGAPVVAVASDGRIGILWTRSIEQSIDNIWQKNSNIFFEILNDSGRVTYGPVNLTNSTAWGQPWVDLNVPAFYNPRITVTGDNNFVLAWAREHQEPGGLVGDIYYAVRNHLGVEVKAVTRLTSDTPGDDEYRIPRLAKLSSNQAYLSWTSRVVGDDNIYYVILNSDGGIAKDITNLSINQDVVNWGNYDSAVQLSGGKILAAWEGWGCFPGEWAPRIRYIFLDNSYNPIGTPVCLDSRPAGTTGDVNLSITTDLSDHAILTWSDGNSSNLYYALLNSSGDIQTAPMIFRTGQSSSPYIMTSYTGFGNTSYSSIPAGVDTMVSTDTPFVFAVPNGTSSIEVNYTNHRLTKATSVVLQAALGTGLTYLDDTSGISPTISGNLITWNLPTLYFLDAGQFALHVQVSSNAMVGSHFSAAFALTENEVDASPNDNTASFEVRVASGQIYLPMVQRKYNVYFEGPWELEPNNTYLQANGPLASGRDYYGYPNDQKDYFIINLPTNGNIVIDLSKYTGQGGQLQLFYQSIDNLVAYDLKSPYQINYPGPAGSYYIYIYTAGNFNSSTAYTLRVTYP